MAENQHVDGSLCGNKNIYCALSPSSGFKNLQARSVTMQGNRALLKLPPAGFLNPPGRFTEAMKPV